MHDTLWIQCFFVTDDAKECEVLARQPMANPKPPPFDEYLTVSGAAKFLNGNPWPFTSPTPRQIEISGRRTRLGHLQR